MAVEPFTRAGAQAGVWTKASDQDCLAAAASQNQQAFAELVKRYHQLVYRVAWRIGAGHAETEDVTQEAFLRLWNDPGQIREAAALKGWLIRVASNLLMDRFRKKPMQALDQADDVADGAPAPVETMDQAWAGQCIDQAIAGLPERQKMALTLVHFEQMTNIAAAAAMQVSVDALESLLARARRGLKEDLKDKASQLLEAVSLEGDKHGR